LKPLLLIAEVIDPICTEVLIERPVLVTLDAGE
jgi:hypothetical protein